MPRAEGDVCSFTQSGNSRKLASLDPKVVDYIPGKDYYPWFARDAPVGRA
jgi:hypothetical protein